MKQIHKSDQDLWEAFLAGNPTAFGKLAERYRDSLMALLYRRTGDRLLAEDLLQDTWLHLWQKRIALSDPPILKLGAWLRSCAHHRWLAHQAKHRNRQQLLQEVVRPSLPVSREAEASENLAVSDLNGAIARVRHPLRRALLQQLAAGEEQSELMAYYRRPSSWVQQNVYLARKELKQVLQQAHLA
jgi:RNA polymerase sigma-70 factor (ECF subfamily)